MRAIAGDWNDDGVDTVGVCNTVNGTFNLRNSNTSGPADMTFSFGAGGAIPLAGDWDGANGDSIGLYVPATSTFLLKNTNANGPADLAFGYGAANSLPVVGDWDGATGPGGVPRSDSRRFVYDRFGNRAAMYNSTSALSPAAQTISLQPLSGQSGVSTNRISQVTSTGAGTVTYAHDRAGNVRNDGVTAYTFDVLGRIDSATTGATMSTFQYDSANRRIQKKVGSSPAIDYVWEGGHVLAEYDRATGVYTDYVWAGSRMVASVRGAATTFHHQDRLSTRLSTDSNGAVTGTQSHFPFGEDAGTSGTVEKHRFTSYERDTESGVDYAVNRQHSAGSGRFTRPDPVQGWSASPQSLNRYSYTVSDPVQYTDPLGLYWALRCWRWTDAETGEALGPEECEAIWLDDPIPPGDPNVDADSGWERFVSFLTFVKDYRPCGRNPITNVSGGSYVHDGSPGNLRPGKGGQGHFGARRRSDSGTVYPHQGADIAGAFGAPVFVNRPGKVIASDAGNSRTGNFVFVDHGGGIVTKYFHLSVVDVKTGDSVNAGTVIGAVGTGGYEQTAGRHPDEIHVHFQVEVNGVPKDPIRYLNSPCP